MTIFRLAILATKHTLPKPSVLLCSVSSKTGYYRSFAAAQITSNDELSTIVQQFPPQIDYAFGYGSAVLHQQNSNPSSSMVDVIMSVPDAHQWHTQNIRQHPDHYSMMAKLGGPSFVTWLQSSFGARIYFHPYVDLDISGSSRKQQIKYGVVSTSDLISDLRCWEYLYLAGRMQKPIVSISLPHGMSLDEDVEKRRKDVRSAQQTNLLAAVSTSLLLIGGEMSKSNTSPMTTLATSKLYTTIASLSYTGDFRMKTGAEDPNKVAKLVETPGMLDLWEMMYADTLNNLQKNGLLSMTKNSESSSAENEVEFDPCDIETRKQLMNHLPPRLRKYSGTIIGLDGSSSIYKGSIALRNELAKIVAPAARNQGAKGIFTAGPLKSCKYAMAKFAKGRLKK